MPDNRRRGWLWIVAALVMVPILYLLSFGPACWLVWYRQVSGERIGRLYFPVLWVEHHGPDMIRNRLHWYVDQWASSTVIYMFPLLPGERPLFEQVTLVPRPWDRPSGIRDSSEVSK